MSVVENFLAEIYRRLRSTRVAILIAGNDLDKHNIKYLNELRMKLKEVGEIRIAEVIYENQIEEDVFDLLSQVGFTNRVVPSNLELSFLLESYDIVLENRADIIILGSHSEDLIPLYMELRKTVSVFAFVDSSKKVSKAFLESFDGIIYQDKIEEFSFTSRNIAELDQIIQQANGLEETHDTTDYTGEEIVESIDQANIGTFSEEYIDNDELIEEMKKERQK